MAKRKPKAKKPTPIPLAMILCDQVLRDGDTGKYVIVGTFSNIEITTLPSVHPSMAIYLALTEGRGKYGGQLRMVHVESDRVLFEAEGPLVFDNPLEVLEIKMILPPLWFKDPGLYALDFSVDESPIVSRKFYVGSPKEKQ